MKRAGGLDRITVIQGDSRERLRDLADASVDSVVCDPPYALVSIVKRFANSPRSERTENTENPYGRTGRGFMGQRWDNGETAFDPAFWEEVLRVLKPGGFVAAFGGTRTFHRLVCAIEDAGFEVRDTISWNFGSGFPKSRNVGRELASLPWCACGGGKEACPATVDAIVSPKLGAALDAGANVLRSDSSGCESAVFGIEASDPLRLGCAGVSAELVSRPATGLAADTARGLGHNLGCGSGHRRAAVEEGVENLVRHGEPVMLGPSDVAVVTEGQEVFGDVSLIQSEPKPLREEVVGKHVKRRSAVGARSVAGDDCGGDPAPPATLVGPPPAPPSGIILAGESDAVVGGHAGAGAVSGAGAALGPRPLSRSVADGALDGFGGHQALVSTKIDAGEISVCATCQKPVAPPSVYEGAGTALKPAMELICLARKPLIGTIASNVLAHGTGALNIDASRIEGGEGGERTGEASQFQRYTEAGVTNFAAQPGPRGGDAKGRWPANVLHDGSDEVVDAFPDSDGQAAAVTGKEPSSKTRNVLGLYNDRATAEPRGDTGSAARFFYSSKADADDRLGSKHPTVKPVDLMAYLVRLVTPPNGLVLDPFAGSGTTGMACMREGFRAILIEREAEYVADIRRRLAHVKGEDAPLFAAAATEEIEPTLPLTGGKAA